MKKQKGEQEVELEVSNMSILYVYQFELLIKFYIVHAYYLRSHTLKIETFKFSFYIFFFY